jgi:F-box protein 1 (cyclin F)
VRALSQPPRTDVSHLPDEMLIAIFSFLSIKDVCSVAQTCRRFAYLSNCKEVLASAGFDKHCDDLWPSPASSSIFLKAARAGNFDAAVKLGIACLYGEGMGADSSLAGEMLTAAERQTLAPTPFAWLLFRPPWSSDLCSKAVIFRAMMQEYERQNLLGTTSRRDSSIMFCIAKTFLLDNV